MALLTGLDFVLGDSDFPESLISCQSWIITLEAVIPQQLAMETAITYYCISKCLRGQIFGGIFSIPEWLTSYRDIKIVSFLEHYPNETSQYVPQT